MKYICSLFCFFLLLNSAADAQDKGSFNYEAAWKRVEDLQNKSSLPKSALEEVEKILSAARAERNSPQLVKAIRCKSSILYRLESNWIPSIDYLRKEAETLPFPEQNIVYSFLLETYFNYTLFNYLQFQTSQMQSASSDDVASWDQNTLLVEVLRTVRHTLSQAERLQTIPTKNYETLLKGDANTLALRPKLYDLLIFRVIDLLRNNQGTLTRKGQELFTYNQTAFFAPAREFVATALLPADTLSIQYQALKLTQEHLGFRLRQSDLDALLDADLNRLKLVRAQCTLEEKDKLYEQALLHLIKTADKSQLVAGDLRYELATLYYSQGEAFRSTNQHRNGMARALELCNEVEAKYKQSTAYKNNQYVAALKRKILAASVDVSVEKYVLPKEASKLLLKYRNTEQVFVSVISLSKDSLSYFTDLNNNWKSILRKNAPVLQKQVKTVHRKDHQSYSAELVMDGLPKGRYLLVVSNRKNATDADAVVDIEQFQVTDVSIITSSAPVMLLRNRKNGEPLSMATVKAFELDGKGRKKLLATFTASQEGEVQVSEGMREKINRGAPVWEITQTNGDVQQFDMNWYSRNRQSDVETPSKLLLFTDRTLYRPGQTLYFKGLLFADGTDGPHALKDEQVKLVLRDANWQEVSTLELVSNEFGSINGSFTLPQGLLNGQMSLQTSFGATQFRVEEYKRPTFEVKMDELQQEVALDQELKLTGTAKAFAGFPIDGAKVRYRVVRNVEPLYPRMWLFADRPYSPMLRTVREIASGETITDATGVFNIAFTTMSEDLDKNDLVYRFVVTADVTDRSGETQSTSYTLRAARKPLLIETSLPERLEVGGKMLFDLKTVNLNGQQVPCRVDVSISQLKTPSRITRKSLWQKPDTAILSREEFERLLPYDGYMGEDNSPENLSVSNQLPALQMNTKDSSQLDLSLLSKQPSGWYAVKISASTNSKLSVDRTYYLQLVNGTPTSIVRDEDWLSAPITTAKPSEELVVWLAAPSDNVRIDYVLYGDQQKELDKRQITAGRVPQRFVIPIKETYRGGVSAQFCLVQNNRFYTKTVQVEVPWDNKKLGITWNTFRDQLQPGQAEKWSLTIKDHKQQAAVAEMVATLYDASLDAFVPYTWKNMEGQIWTQSSYAPSLSELAIISYFQGYNNAHYYSYSSLGRNYMSIEPLLGFGLTNDYIVVGYGSPKRKSLARSAAEAPAPASGLMETSQVMEDAIPFAMEGKMDTRGVDAEPTIIPVTPRTNFNETAFFFPSLRTNEQGELVMEFQMAESITRWKMMGFAHTQDMKVGYTEQTVVTRKEVAITAHAPRFFRVGDTIVLTARVNNSAGKDLQATASLRLFDPVSGKELTTLLLSPASQTVSMPKDQSGTAAWTLHIPEGLQALTYRVTAQAEQHTDGEERTAPVLPNAMLVTESMPFMLRGGEQKTFTFDRLKNAASPTLQHQSLTLEFTSNPAWYAIQALPYLMEYPYNCSEQIFSRYFANSIAQQVTASSPRVKQVFDLWSNIPDSKALLSNLEKNQELKQALLEETPWVMDAKDETERKKRVGLLFDLNRMGSEQQKAIDELSKRQKPNGAFPWFEGMDDSRYITQHIVVGLQQLKQLGALNAKHQEQANKIVEAGMRYCDEQIGRDYMELTNSKVKMDEQQIGSIQVHYLYACSFGKHVPSFSKQAKAHLYYADQAERYWMRMGLYEQGLVALWAHRTNRTKLAQGIVASLREHAKQSEQQGMYWNLPRGMYWNQAPIETQALMAEVFNEVVQDEQSVEEIKVWLLLNKQTNDWKTTKATTAACYALLMTGDKLLESTELLEAKVGGKSIDSKSGSKQEAGTGYVKTSWSGAEIKPAMATLKVKNPNKGLAWGAMYWQYFEQQDKITQAETNIKITRQLYLKTMTANGPVLVAITARHPLKVGDLVTVRMELRADRDFEYVHLKDMRAAGFEPVSALSGYRYAAGLGYYQNIKDASMNFFMDGLPKGTHVLEYDLRVSHEGSFSNGVSTLQCMYAPEFGAHSEGMRVEVGE